MNRLAQTTSPYLLQHAHNPVDWYPWGVEAITKAKAENKPIFLSIGYAACHWCHVMAHESFEDPETATFMNEHFINIKVDREERPDIDSIYMQATIAMTGSGGWPMSVFLAPDLKPFYTGTYFPPVRRYNMPAFKDVLSGLANAWVNDRSEVDKVGEQIIGHLQKQINIEKGDPLTLDNLETIADAMTASYDWGYGGWGDAPKFPQAMVLDYLIEHKIFHKDDTEISEKISKLMNHCLQAMTRGGMYDVVGGGFSRYSTDKFWRVPHFEKMLYDNALLVRTYLHAWQVTNNPSFKRIVEETLDFVMREMTHEQGGFYSSLDADSEGEEGKFYVWSLDEIREILKGESDLFEAAYGITFKGNWDGKTVLHRALDDSSLAARFNLDVESVLISLKESHSKLYVARSLRIRPGTDDKILTSWNGLMLAAFAESSRVLDNKEYHQVATRSAYFILSSLRPNGQLHRSWRNGTATAAVFLEDYAALILGLLELYQTDFDTKWFTTARDLTDEMIEKFGDSTGGFFDTLNDGEALLIRPKDITDNATPSGNALACEALLKLAAFTDYGKYRDLAEKALAIMGVSALRYPLGFARWLSSSEIIQRNIKQVAVFGDTQDENYKRLLKLIRAEYRPGMVVAASSHPPPKAAPALLNGRAPLNGLATAYVCEGFVCKQPTTNLEILKIQLNS